MKREKDIALNSRQKTRLLELGLTRPKEEAIHDPDEPPRDNADFETYLRSNSSTVNHFHEKLFLLKDRMNTESARRLAAGRHSFMKSYLNRFISEWTGES